MEIVKHSKLSLFKNNYPRFTAASGFYRFTMLWGEATFRGS